MDSLQFPSLSSVLGSPTPSDVTPRPPQNGNVSEEDSDEFSGESSENGEEEDLTWIDWFTHLNGNEYFAEIDEDFLRDDFNLTGLSSAVQYYEHAMDLILDEDTALEHFTEEQQDLIDESAEVLYGLVHASMKNIKLFISAVVNACTAMDNLCFQMDSLTYPALTLSLYIVRRAKMFITHVLLNMHKLTERILERRLHICSCCRLQQPFHQGINPLSVNCSYMFRPKESYVPRIFGFRISKESPYYKAEAPVVPVKRGKITVNVTPSPPEGAVTPSEPGTPLAVTPAVEYGEMKTISPQLSNLTL